MKTNYTKYFFLISFIITIVFLLFPFFIDLAYARPGGGHSFSGGGGSSGGGGGGDDGIAYLIYLIFT
jgi:hypothetical protein